MKKSLFSILFANVFYLLIVAGTNFILPKFVSVEIYAAIKEYTLYITTYAGLSTLGYAEGVYVKYGGKNIENLDPKTVGASVFSFFVFMLPISVAVSVWGILARDTVLSIVGAGLLATNMGSFYQLFYQATGDFKSYGTALNASRILMLAAYLTLIFIVRTDSLLAYVGIAPVVGIVTAAYLTVKLNKRIPLIKNLRMRFGEIRSNIRGGFVLMLGGFVSSYFTSIDRWFVKTLTTTLHFAVYSFAVSMENMVNTLMTPITVSMYNFFCKEPSIESVRRMKNSALVYAFVIIASAFPLKWILEVFLTNYLAATDIMFFLFAAQGFSSIIRGIYVNKYKAEGKQKLYLLQMIAMLVLAVVLNFVFFWVCPDITAFAVATLAVNIVWLIVCEWKAPELRYDLRAIASIAILLAAYLLAGHYLNSILGCIVYVGAGVAVGLTLMRDSFIGVITSVWDSVFGKLKKK